MNTYRFRQLLIAVFSGILFVLALVLLPLVLSPNVQARVLSPAYTESINSPGSLVQLRHASVITFTPSFTVYLSLAMKSAGTISCGPGQTIADPANDVSPAHIDVITLNTSLNGESLQAVFKMREVPYQLTFNRVGVPQHHLEYGWHVFVDIDNNPQTGSEYDLRGAEYLLGATHFVSQPDSPATQPIANGVEVNTWRYDSESTLWSYLASGTLNVDPQSDTITLTGNIPGINSGSRLFFVTYDYNPEGTPQIDKSLCGTAASYVDIGIQQELVGTLRYWKVLRRP